MRDEEHIGARVAVERRLRGLTQRQLADRAHVSLSLLRKVEQGSKPASPAVVTAVAGALHIDPTALTGQPYRTGDRREDAVHGLIPALRRELVSYRLVADDDRRAPTLGQLRIATAELSRLRHRTDMLSLGARLPDVLADLRLASHLYDGTKREEVMGLLAEAYDAARQLTYKLGYNDLASMLADRYEWAAAQSGDPLAVAVGETMRAAELIGAGEFRAAEQIMTDARARLEPAVDSDDESTLSVFGYLHLEAALATARAGKSDTTDDHLREADDIAARVAPDRDDYRLVFNSSNVAIWRVALAVEMMDGAKAVARARETRLDPSTPPERVGHHYIDLARGQLLYGDRHGALDSLQAARRVAPQQLRYHPMARDTVYALARAERRASDSVRGLANWMGIQD